MFLRLILINNHNIRKKIFSFRNSVEKIATYSPKDTRTLHNHPTQPIPTLHNQLPTFPPLQSFRPHQSKNSIALKNHISQYKNQSPISHGILLHIAIGGPKFLHNSRFTCKKLGGNSMGTCGALSPLSSASITIF